MSVAGLGAAYFFDIFMTATFSVPTVALVIAVAAATAVVATAVLGMQIHARAEAVCHAGHKVHAGHIAAGLQAFTLVAATKNGQLLINNWPFQNLVAGTGFEPVTFGL